MFVPFSSWIPDADQTMQGILVDVNNAVPTLRGWKGAPEPTSRGLPALAAACTGAELVITLSGTVVMFAGTATALYKAGETSWEDVTRVSGGAYGGGTWRFAQQGNVTFAVNKTDTPQKYDHTSDTDFSALSAMPKAALVEAVGQFVMIANYNGGTNYVDGWGCSAIGDYTDWTASIDTQCVYGRLVDTPGEITGLKRLGDYAIFYKRKSTYLARYVGVPSVWEFSLVSDIIGAVSQEAIAKIGTTHYFLGDEDFYAYDSASLRPIGGDIREWFNRNCNNAYRHKTQTSHDIANGIVYWFYCYGTSTTPNAWVAFNYRSNKWGKGEKSVEAACEYVVGGVSYSTLTAKYSTYADYGTTTYEGLIATSGSVLPALFNTSHVLQTLTGTPTTSTITTNDFGIDDGLTLVRRVRPRYLLKGDTAVCVNYYRNQLGGALTEDATTTESDGKFDVLRTSRWHRGKITFTGNIEVTGLDVDARQVSAE